MKLFNKLFPQNPLKPIMKFSMTITHRSSKKFCCHYYLSDIKFTVRTVAHRDIIFGLFLTPEKIPGYNWGRWV
jgi:hypothetical protein